MVGLPKTIDNDVIPIRQSLGAWTAADQGALFARNIIAEHSSNPRMLIVHEVMGRNCGWLTAATARRTASGWTRRTGTRASASDQAGWDVHAVYVPEATIDLDAEAERLRKVMDENDCVNIFLSEGAGCTVDRGRDGGPGEEVGRDPFGHVKLDTINPGAWFAKQFAERIGAEKTMVQKTDTSAARRGQRPRPA